MTHPFTDVPPDAYYADAVEWAWANGLTTGVAPRRFAPDDPVTRAQLVTMLHRYDVYRGIKPGVVRAESEAAIGSLDADLAELEARVATLEDGVALPEPPDPDPPTRGPVWVPKFGGGEVGILIPDGFPHPDNYKGLPTSRTPIDTRSATRTENLVVDLRGQDVPWAMGAPDNGREFTARNVLFLVDHADAIKAARNVLIDGCCIISFGAAPGAHVDCIQNSGGGSNVRVRRSTLICRHQNSTNAFRAASNVGPIDDCWVEDSFLFGGSYSADFDVKNHPITNSGLRRCVFAGKSTGVWRASGVVSGGALHHNVRTEGGARVIDCTVLPESEWRVDR